MGKNVLKIPGAVAADPDEGEPEPAETAKAHRSEVSVLAYRTFLNFSTKCLSFLFFASWKLSDPHRRINQNGIFSLLRYFVLIQNVEGQTSARTHAEPIPERSRAHSQEHHEPGGNPHPHSPGKPPIAPRSAHVTRMAHAASAHAPSHVPQTQLPQTQPPQQYHTEFQNPQPTQTQIPPQQQMLALYQVRGIVFPAGHWFRLV